MRRKLADSALTILMILCGLAGCSDDSTAPAPRASLSLGMSVQPTAKAPGDVALTRVRFLLRDIRLTDATEVNVNFVTEPRIADLSLDGTITELSVQGVPVGTYQDLRFDVHRLDSDDPADQAVLERPEFSDFNVFERPSIIVEGTYDDGSGPASFVFMSDDNAEQRVDFASPLELTETTDLHVTISVDPSQWFIDTQGAPLDPREAGNESQISDNIRNSVEGFRDDDRDGQPDSSG